MANEKSWSLFFAPNQSDSKSFFTPSNTPCILSGGKHSTRSNRSSRMMNWGKKPNIPLTCCMFDKIHSEIREQRRVKSVMGLNRFSTSQANYMHWIYPTATTKNIAIPFPYFRCLFVCFCACHELCTFPALPNFIYCNFSVQFIQKYKLCELHFTYLSCCYGLTCIFHDTLMSSFFLIWIVWISGPPFCRLYMLASCLTSAASTFIIVLMYNYWCL